MTPGELILARDGDAAASAGAVEVWQSIIGHGAVGDADYVKSRVRSQHAGAALDAVSGYQGAATDVLVHTLAEVVFRTGSYLQHSGAMLGFHGSLGEGMPDGDASRSGYSALRRSGSMNLLELSKVRRAGLI